MAFPKPTPGQVIRYSYLWHKDAVLGSEEGSKDRPCAIVMMVQDENGDEIVTVLPVTHSPPHDPSDALEIPSDTKRRLGLDGERSWIIITESNRYLWPGPDIRMLISGDAASVLYGSLPGGFFERVRLAFLGKVRFTRASTNVTRTE